MLKRDRNQLVWDLMEARYDEIAAFGDHPDPRTFYMHGTLQWQVMNLIAWDRETRIPVKPDQKKRLHMATRDSLPVCGRKNAVLVTNNKDEVDCKHCLIGMVNEWYVPVRFRRNKNDPTRRKNEAR